VKIVIETYSGIVENIFYYSSYNEHLQVYLVDRDPELYEDRLQELNPIIDEGYVFKIDSEVKDAIRESEAKEVLG